MGVFLVFLLFFVLAVSLSGCGTIFNGTSQDIRVKSSPLVVRFIISPGGTEYTTPTWISLKKKNNYTLTFRKAGYRVQRFEIQKSLNRGIFVLDILTVIGVPVDAFTGAWYNLTPTAVTVSLFRVGVIDGPEQLFLVEQGHVNPPFVGRVKVDDAVVELFQGFGLHQVGEYGVVFYFRHAE